MSTLIINIECFEDTVTSISYNGYTIRAPFTQNLIQNEAQAIVKQAHYNELFSIQIKHNSEHERAKEEANLLKQALTTEIEKVPHLNLAIAGQEPADWAARKATTDQEQMAILKKALIVREQIGRRGTATPARLADLQHIVNHATPKALLGAKSYLKSYDLEKKQEERTSQLPYWGLAVLLFGGFTIGLALGGVPLVALTALLIASLVSLIGFACLCYDFKEKENFYAKIGYSDTIGKLEKLSEDFLNSLQTTPSQIPAPLSTQNPSPSNTPEPKANPRPEGETLVSPSEKPGNKT